MMKSEAAYQRIRQASYLPLIVIGIEEEATEILEFGADACITRETDLRELVARVRSILRRKMGLRQGTGGKNSGDGNYDDPVKDPIDEDDSDGAKYLNATEFRLVSCLVLNKSKLLDYQHICEGWEGKEVSLDTLHNYMHSLSQKLPAYFPYPIDILNYRDEGYCLVDSSEEGTVSI